MHHVTFDALTFIDSGGKYRKIYGCPLKQRKELHHALTELHKRLAASKIQTITSLYDDDPEFQAIADECLSLCRIDPNWLTIDMLIEFLLPHRKNDAPQRPLLETLNFPPNSEGVSATEAEAIAALWSHTQDLEQALKLAGYQPGEAPPWDELVEVMQARNAASPEGQAERETEEIAEQLEKQAIGVNGMAIASPQQTEKFMEALFSG